MFETHESTRIKFPAGLTSSDESTWAYVKHSAGCFFVMSTFTTQQNDTSENHTTTTYMFSFLEHVMASLKNPELRAQQVLLCIANTEEGYGWTTYQVRNIEIGSTKPSRGPSGEVLVNVMKFHLQGGNDITIEDSQIRDSTPNIIWVRIYG